MRKLLMQTNDNGISCLWASAQAGHVYVVQTLLTFAMMSRGSDLVRDVLMQTSNNRSSCLYASADKGHVHIVRVLLLAAGDAARDLAMLTDPDQLTDSWSRDSPMPVRHRCQWRTGIGVW